MDYKSLEQSFANYILSLIGPTAEQENDREQRFTTIKSIIKEAFMYDSKVTPYIYCFGSYPMKTYLPESDLDITVILENNTTGTLITNYTYEALNK